MKNPDLPLHLQIIIKAYSLLKEFGRCCGVCRDAEGRFCIEGALRMAYALQTGATPKMELVSYIPEPDAQQLVMIDATHALKLNMPHWCSLWLWQDRPETTDQDVWDLFERTIASEMSKIAEKTTA